MAALATKKNSHPEEGREHFYLFSYDRSYRRKKNRPSNKRDLLGKGGVVSQNACVPGDGREGGPGARTETRERERERAIISRPNILWSLPE